MLLACRSIAGGRALGPQIQRGRASLGRPRRVYVARASAADGFSDDPLQSPDWIVRQKNRMSYRNWCTPHHLTTASHNRTQQAKRDKLMQLTVDAQLKPLLKSYKLSSSGRKSELVERILRHELEQSGSAAPADDVRLEVFTARALLGPRGTSLPWQPRRHARRLLLTGLRRPPPPPLRAGHARRLLRAGLRRPAAHRLHGARAPARLPFIHPSPTVTPNSLSPLPYIPPPPAQLLPSQDLGEFLQAFARAVEYSYVRLSPPPLFMRQWPLRERVAQCYVDPHSGASSLVALRVDERTARVLERVEATGGVMQALQESGQQFVGLVSERFKASRLAPPPPREATCPARDNTAQAAHNHNRTNQKPPSATMWLPSDPTFRSAVRWLFFASAVPARPRPGEDG